MPIDDRRPGESRNDYDNRRQTGRTQVATKPNNDSDAKQPDAKQPDIKQPDVGQLDVGQPDVSQARPAQVHVGTAPGAVDMKQIMLDEQSFRVRVTSELDMLQVAADQALRSSNTEAKAFAQKVHEMLSRIRPHVPRHPYPAVPATVVDATHQPNT